MSEQEKKQLIELKGDIEISAEYFRRISKELIDNGKINLELNNLLDSEKLKSCLRIAGFTNINITDNTVTAEKKVINKGTKNENPWKMIKLEEKTDLILEDELIDPYDNFQKFSKASDCITKPKPCKNCNCGRAQQENVTNTDFKPECGKCYLGDAFRCEGCPYRGKPAFEPGDKVQFENLTENVNVESETNTIKVTGKKVTLDI
jgi:hypothetical protein